MSSIYIKYYIKLITNYHNIWFQVILFETYVIVIALVINIILSINKSKRFFKILDLFDRFDELILQVQCSSNYKAQQFYVIYALLVWVYHLSVMVVVFFDILYFFLLFMWSTICLSTTIAILPYIICIRMLRHRYKLANKVFKNSKYLLQSYNNQIYINTIWWFIKYETTQSTHSIQSIFKYPWTIY